MLIGVAPDGTAIGQQVGQRTIDHLTQEMRRISPPAYPSVEEVRVGADRHLIAVAVETGASQPYIYRGVAYRRSGNTTLALSQDQCDQMILERYHNEQRWENQPAEGWSIDDLDMGEIRRTLKEAVRQGRLEERGSQEPADMLRDLGLLEDGILLRAAVVLFGHSKRIKSTLPQCLLRVARFRGVEPLVLLDNRQFRGNAFFLLESAERFLMDALPPAPRDETERSDRPDDLLFPSAATREALANALCHRDYLFGGGSIGVAVFDDRLEITSDGPLHFGLTPETLFGPHPSRPWNPLIANAFYRRGIIERWGAGTLKMVQLVESAGLPTPEIEDSGLSVTVRFRSIGRIPHPPAGYGHINRKVAILGLLGFAPWCLAVREICAKLAPSATEHQVRRALTDLRHRGRVVPTGRGRASRWIRTWRD